jgi:hypothetical protein
MKEIKKVACLFLTLVFLATSCVSAPPLSPVDATAAPAIISTPATETPSKTVSACTEAGVLQKGVAAGVDGFSIPFQAYLPLSIGRATWRCFCGGGPEPGSQK